MSLPQAHQRALDDGWLSKCNSSVTCYELVERPPTLLAFLEVFVDSQDPLLVDVGPCLVAGGEKLRNYNFIGLKFQSVRGERYTVRLYHDDGEPIRGLRALLRMHNPNVTRLCIYFGNGCWNENIEEYGLTRLRRALADESNALEHLEIEGEGTCLPAALLVAGKSLAVSSGKFELENLEKALLKRDPTKPFSLALDENVADDDELLVVVEHLMELGGECWLKRLSLDEIYLLNGQLCERIAELPLTSLSITDFHFDTFQCPRRWAWRVVESLKGSRSLRLIFNSEYALHHDEIDDHDEVKSLIERVLSMNNLHALNFGTCNAIDESFTSALRDNRTIRSLSVNCPHNMINDLVETLLAHPTIEKLGLLGTIDADRYIAPLRRLVDGNSDVIRVETENEKVLKDLQPFLAKNTHRRILSFLSQEGPEMLPFILRRGISLGSSILYEYLRLNNEYVFGEHLATRSKYVRRNLARSSKKRRKQNSPR